MGQILLHSEFCKELVKFADDGKGMDHPAVQSWLWQFRETVDLQENRRGFLDSDGFFQSIEVVYVGPSAFRGARARATASSCRKSATIPWCAGVSEYQNYEDAAKALAKKLDWPLTGWHRGWTKKGVVFVKS